MTKKIRRTTLSVLRCRTVSTITILTRISPSRSWRKKNYVNIHHTITHNNKLRRCIYLSINLLMFTALSEEILLSFSLTTNFRAICDQAVGSDTIPCIHGIRALSMAWIILGHTCIISFKYSDNMELRKVVEQSFFFQTISNGAFSVDTFFFISGFLVSFLYFR